jgi:Polyketide cyclase / dehydrase and lipid transport
MSQVQGTPIDFSYTLHTTASKETLWCIWTDVKNWHTWDTPLREATLEGEFQQGSKGNLITAQGQHSSFTITEYKPMQSYAFTTQLPVAKLTVRRYFSGETMFTHHITFSGPLGFLFAALLGRGFMKALPPVMENLKRMAEASSR